VRILGADTGGATAIEYALIAGLISVFIVGALNLLGSQIASLYVSIAGAMP
jgi:pilus assembly protein Flp/PilA